MVKTGLLLYELQDAGLSVIGCGQSDAIRPATNASWHPKDAIYARVDWPSEPIQADIDAASVIVAAHNPEGDLPWIAHRKEVKARFLLHELKDKTPTQIYTMMQNAMDNWTTLADARSDLREWLPLMAAVISWSVGLQDNE
jgi:hypothetical protein